MKVESIAECSNFVLSENQSGKPILIFLSGRFRPVLQ